MTTEPTTREEAIRTLKSALEEKSPDFDILSVWSGRDGFSVEDEEYCAEEEYNTDRVVNSSRKFILPMNESERLCEIINEYADNSRAEIDFGFYLVGVNIKSRFPNIDPSLNYSGIGVYASYPEIGVYASYPEGEIPEEVRYFLEGVDTISRNFEVLERKVDEGEWERI